jgi:hypothetical protein
MLRDLDGANDTVDLQPPAKATADEMIVDHHLVQRQDGDFRSGRLGARDGLVADPNFAAVLADMDRAVHRLHCGVREERNLIDRLDLGDGVRHGPVDIADILRNRTRIERRPLIMTSRFRSFVGELVYLVARRSRRGQSIRQEPSSYHAGRQVNRSDLRSGTAFRLRCSSVSPGSGLGAGLSAWRSIGT